MKPDWLIEAGVFGEAADPLKLEISRQGMAVHMVRPVRGRLSAEGIADDACVIFYGSHPLMREIQLRHRGWVPGCWCSFENLDCASYYPHFGEYLLNQRQRMLPGIEAIREADELFAELGKSGQVFVRPTSVVKIFTGRCMTRDEFPQALAPARYDPETRVLIAEPRPVAREWRLVVAADEVIAGCQYAMAGARAFAPDVPASVRSFAERVLQAVAWRPDPVFIMDVGESDGGLHVVELNSFSCSGLYACDLEAVVARTSELAERAGEATNARAS